MAKQSTVGFQS